MRKGIFHTNVWCEVDNNDEAEKEDRIGLFRHMDAVFLQKNIEPRGGLSS